ncbi:MAG: tRNA (adenosine(37)-N6)-threonylcarbamoyltransferase complex ATPase subunit type 1 TsaE [Betaproteobacteria bacterium]
MFQTSSPHDTRRLGEALGRLLGPGDVVCLEGELGAGKTVFVQGVAAGMGVRGRVASPTFTIIHEHPGKVPLYHVDAYRLEGVEDAGTVGIEECLYGRGAVAVEWPQRIQELLPDERLDVVIRVPADAGEGGRAPGSEGGSSAREIAFLPHGERFRRMIEELKALAGPRY